MRCVPLASLFLGLSVSILLVLPLCVRAGRKRKPSSACGDTRASPRGRSNLHGHARLMLGSFSACTWLRKTDEPASCANVATEWPLSHLSQPQTRDPQTLIKAALCLYQGGGLASAGAPRNNLADSQLIHFLHGQMKRSCDVSSVQLMINVAQLLTRSPPNTTLLLPLLPTVMELLGKHMEHEGLQESGVGLLGNLACSDENRGELIRLGSIGHVLRCWKVHAASVGLCHNAFRMMRNLCSGGASSGYADDLKEHGVPQVVCTTLRGHGDNERLAEQALACLWGLACLPLLAADLFESNAPEAILRVMALHPSSSQVQRCGCGAIARLLEAAAREQAGARGRESHCEAESTEQEARSAAAAGLLSPAALAPAVLLAARSHPLSAAVQALAMEVAAGLIVSARRPALEPEQARKALRLAADAMGRLPASPAVAEYACLLFAAAVAQGPSLCAQHEALRAVPLALAALDRHPQQRELHVAVCFLLRGLCEARHGGPACSEALVDAGALPAMLHRARCWLHEVELLEPALGVLRCLGSFAPACMESFTQHGGHRLLLEAMVRHSRRAPLQEACCSLLWSASMASQCAHGPSPLSSADALPAALLPLGAAWALRVVPLQVQLCGLLRSLSLRAELVGMLCGGDGEWLALLAASMVAQPREAKVQEHACATFANLLAASAARADGADADAGAGAVRSSICLHLRRLDVLELCARALRCSPRARPELQAEGMLLLRRAAGSAALLPALLACGAPQLLALALGCDDANTPGGTPSSSTVAASTAPAAVASSTSIAASSSTNAASRGRSYGHGHDRAAERAHHGEAAARHAAAALHAILALSTSRLLVAQHARSPTPCAPCAPCAPRAPTPLLAAPLRALYPGMGMARAWLQPSTTPWPGRSLEADLDVDLALDLDLCFALPMPLDCARGARQPELELSLLGTARANSCCSGCGRSCVGGAVAGAAPWAATLSRLVETSALKRGGGGGGGSGGGASSAAGLPVGGSREWVRAEPEASVSPALELGEWTAGAPVSPVTGGGAGALDEATRVPPSPCRRLPFSLDAAASLGVLSVAGAQDEPRCLGGMAADVLRIVLAHVCADLRSACAALATCTRWQRLLRGGGDGGSGGGGGGSGGSGGGSSGSGGLSALHRLSLVEHGGELRSGALSLPRLLRLPHRGPRLLCLSQLDALTDAALREALPACPHLAALDVSHCGGLGHAAISLIAAHCPRLVELNLAAVGAVDDVALDFLAARCKHLRLLCLNGCGAVRDEGLRVLATGCGQLRGLHLFGCTRVTEAGVAAVARGCTYLASIDLGATAAANEASLNFLAQHRAASLRVVGLCAADVGDEALAAFVGVCTQLQALFAPNCARLTAASVGALQHSCPALTLTLTLTLALALALTLTVTVTLTPTLTLTLTLTLTPTPTLTLTLTPTQPQP